MIRRISLKWIDYYQNIFILYIILKKIVYINMLIIYKEIFLYDY